MKKLSPKSSLIIPEHEIEIISSRSGGAGGQHVNKTNTRITLRWNIKNTSILSAEQKERVLEKLQPQLTIDGDLIIHKSETRSLEQNKKLALTQLHHILNNALMVPKKRIATKISKHTKQVRAQSKARHSVLKKLRSKHFDE